MQPVPTGGTAAWTARTTPTRVVRRDGATSTSQMAAVEVLREMVGDLPPEVSFVGGSASATATLTIDQPAVSEHPLTSTDAATVLAQTIEVEAGFGGSTVRLFTGTAREWSMDDAGMVQTIKAADGADLLAAPVTLPPFGSIGQGAPLTRSLRRYPTNSAAVVVAALHACGVRVTPAGSSTTVARVPLVGGFLPDPDQGSTFPTGPGVTDGVTWLSNGPFGPCPTMAGGALTVRPGKAAPWVESMAFALEVWVDATPQAATRTLFDVKLTKSGGHVRLQMSPANVLTVEGRSVGAGSWSTIASALTLSVDTFGWHRVALRFAWGGDGSLWWDTTTATTTSFWAGMTQPPESPTIEVDVVPDGHLQGLVVAYSAQGMAWSPTAPTFTSAATISAGALDMDVLPTIAGTVAWDLIKAVTGAELGQAGFDESGRFVFRSRSDINAVTTPVETIDTATAANVRGRVTTAGIRTRVTASLPRPWFRRSYPATSPHVPPTLAQDVLSIPVGIVEQVVPVSTPLLIEDSFVGVYSSPSSIESEAAAGMVLCTDAAGAGLFTGSTVLASVRPLGSGAVVLRTRNYSGSTLYAVWPSAWSASSYGTSPGGPSLWLFGPTLASGEDLTSLAIDVRNPTAAASWGDRTYELPVSSWPGSPSSVTALATGLLADLDGPRVLLDPIEVPADPRRQLGDVITLHDVQGVWADMLARVVSIRTRLSRDVEGTMTQTLGLRALAS